ncbi:MAG: FkbM family methyltransferase [Chitinophagaceae bacterium]
MNLTDILGKAEGFLRKSKNALIRKSDPQFREVEKWYREDPRGLKRSEFEFLTPESIVFDLGGYLGEWTSNLYSRYNCKIHIFEPVKEYADIIAHRFSHNKRITVVQAGLASADLETFITLDEFESKVVGSDHAIHKTEPIRLKAFQQYVSQTGIDKIDLVKINIEGAEYDLLDHLISTGQTERINCFLIQFHNWEQNATTRREKIRQELSKTHTEVFNYSFVWECWQKK